MMKMIAVIVLLASAGVALRLPANGQKPLLRRYRKGEKLAYHMKAVNEDWHYEIQAEGVVKKDSDGSYLEEYGWSGFISDGQKVTLSPATLNFRQQVTLDPNHKPVFPNLSQVDPRLIGPLTDFMTFYVDLWLATRSGRLAHPGDHFYIKRGTPNSWADGTYVVLAQDSIDFDLTLKAINPSGDTGVILVRHVPPESPQISLPVEWMRAPVSDTANNWLQVEKAKDGKYIASVGKETFDVELKVSLSDGKILSATMENPVTAIDRQCSDAALTSCSDPKPHSIMRHVEIALVP